MPAVTRSRNTVLLIGGCLLVMGLFTLMLLTSRAQAAPDDQVSTAMYFGEGKYSVDAAWEGNQYSDICSARDYKGDVALTLFDDGTFALIFTADNHYLAWATPGSSVTCIGPVGPGNVVEHYFVGTYTSNPLKLNFQRAYMVQNSTNEIDMRFSSGQVNFSEAGAVGEVQHWMYINYQSNPEGKATFTLRFDLSRAGGAILTTPTATEETGQCYPLINVRSDLRPGEDLSPEIDFVDETGKPTGIIGHALFINGVETWSVVWDGQATTLEVQYTCLDHTGYFKIVTIPAYLGVDAGAPAQPPQSPQQPQSPPVGVDGNPPNQPGDGSAVQPGQAPSGNQPALPLPGLPITLPTAVGVLGIAVGLGGAAVSGGAVVVSVLNTVLTKPPAPLIPPAQKPTGPPDKKGATKEKEAKKGKEKEGEKEKKEKKPERKGLLASEKEALEKYKEALEKLSDSAGKGLELIDNIREISKESKERLKKELEDFQKKLGVMTKKIDGYTEKIEMIEDIQSKLQSLGQKYKQIQKAHQEAFKDLEDLPEGTANQVADLTTAIETFGDVTDAALSRIPYFKHIYSDKAFEVTKSFKEFSKGLRKLVKTIHRSTIEAKQVFTPKELEAFGLKPNQRMPPEMQQFYRQQALKQPQPQPDSYWQKLKDFIFGKEVSPKYKSMR